MTEDMTQWGKVRDQVRIEMEVQRYDTLVQRDEYMKIVKLSRRAYYINRDHLQAIVNDTKALPSNATNEDKDKLLMSYSDFVVHMKYDPKRQKMNYIVLKDTSGEFDVQS